MVGGLQPAEGRVAGLCCGRLRPARLREPQGWAVQYNIVNRAMYDCIMAWAGRGGGGKTGWGVAIVGGQQPAEGCDSGPPPREAAARAALKAAAAGDSVFSCMQCNIVLRAI